MSENISKAKQMSITVETDYSVYVQHTCYASKSVSCCF